MTWPIFHPLANRDRRSGAPCSYVIEHRRKSGRCKTRSREFCCLAACACVRDNCIAELRAISNKTAAEFRKSIWLSGSSKLESESQDKEIKTGLDYMRAIEFKRESARSYNGAGIPGRETGNDRPTVGFAPNPAHAARMPRHAPDPAKTTVFATIQNSAAAASRDDRQRSRAVALGRILGAKDCFAECDQFEAASRGTRNRDAPMPAAILLEYMEDGGRLARWWCRSRHGVLSRHGATEG